MSPTLLTILAFGAAASAVAGAYSIFSDLYLSDRSRVSRRIDDEFRERQRDRARRSLLLRDPGALAAALGSEEDEVRLTARQRLEFAIEQSGLDTTPRRLLLTSAAAAVGLGALLGLVKLGLPAVAVGVLVGAVAPLVYVQARRKARLEKLLSQLPDAFDLMGRVVRAGQTMSQALQAVADEFAQPIAGEFNYCYEQQNLGLPPDVALRDLARRTGLLEVKIFVLAMLVQQQTGGNLAELLDKLSAIIRERYKLRGQIKALTAEGRLQATILLGLPVAMFAMLLVVNRDYALVLLQFPALIAVTLGCEAIGALWIRKIVNFDF